MTRVREPKKGDLLVYDTGALLAAENRSLRMKSFHDEAEKNRAIPIVPVVVLAQAWRGGPQVLLSRLLKGCDVEPVNEEVAREAGRACGVAGTSDVVDAIVVVMAAKLRAMVVTSDKDDIEHLADAIAAPIGIYPLN